MQESEAVNHFRLFFFFLFCVHSPIFYYKIHKLELRVPDSSYRLVSALLQVLAGRLSSDSRGRDFCQPAVP